MRYIQYKILLSVSLIFQGKKKKKKEWIHLNRIIVRGDELRTISK